MVAKKSVDDIWKELNKGNAPKSSAGFDRLWRNVNNNTDVDLRKDSQKKADLMASLLPGVKPSAGPGNPGDRPSLASAHAGEVETSHVFSSLEEISQALARDINSISDENSSTRKRALLKLQAAVLGANRPTDALLQQVAEDLLVKPLLRRFDDPAEKCRELAVTLVSTLLEEVPDTVHYLLPYVMPVLGERLSLIGKEGMQNPAEPSEEIRLLHIRLLRHVVRQSHQSIARYTGDVSGMLMNAVKDEYPDLLVEACQTQDEMTSIMEMRLQPVAKQLVAAFSPLMAHRRQRVRVAALETLRTLMCQGAHEMILEISSFRDPNLVSIKEFYGEGEVKMNFLGRLANDKNTQVREQFIRTLGHWMTVMNERLDHEVRLMPYVVGALHDPAPSVQQLALALVEKCGKQYEEENQKDLVDTLDYLPEELGSEERVYGPGGAPSVLPPPFTQRLSVGARINGLGVFSKLHTVMLKEVEQVFNEEHRVRAMKLLNSFLVFAEENATQHLHALLPRLAAVCRDPGVRPHVLEGARLIGVFCTPEACLDVLMSYTGASQETRVRANTLTMLAGLMAGARVHPHRWAPHLRALSFVLSEPELLKSADGHMRAAVLSYVEGILGIVEELASRPEPSDHELPSDLPQRYHGKAPPLSALEGPRMDADELEPLLLGALLHVQGGGGDVSGAMGRLSRARGYGTEVGAGAASAAGARACAALLQANRRALLGGLALEGSPHVHADVDLCVRLMGAPELCGAEDVAAVAAAAGPGVRDTAGTSVGALLLDGLLRFVGGVPRGAVGGGGAALLGPLLCGEALGAAATAGRALEGAALVLTRLGDEGSSPPAGAGGAVLASLAPLRACLREGDAGARLWGARVLAAAAALLGSSSPPGLVDFCLDEAGQRLDDSSDEVRAAGAGVLSQVVAAAGPSAAGAAAVSRACSAALARVRPTGGMDEEERAAEEAFQGGPLRALLAAAAVKHPGVVAEGVAALPDSSLALPAVAGLRQ